MNILITGATGYIGSNLTRRLVNEDNNVSIIIRSNSKLNLIKDIVDKINIHVHDGTTEGMMKILEKVQPDIVFHLASKFISKHKSEDIKPLIESNILFGTQLIEAMSKNNIKYLINTGTAWQHYKNCNYNPVCLYAATKQAFEDILKYYIEVEELKVITLKLFDTYGPNDRRPKIMNLLNRISGSKEELLMSPGQQYLDLVYIDDVIEAFLRAGSIIRASIDIKQESYVVSSGKPIKLKDLVEIFEKISGRKLNVKWGGLPYRNREVMYPWDKGRTLEGWKPRISIEDGIKKIIWNRKKI